MDWVRGETVGRGSFATVNLVIPKSNSNSTPTAVKTSEVSTSSSLKNEKYVLHQLGSCQRIIPCFGDDYTFENGKEYYNLFLEYASAGTLSDQVKLNGGRIPEQHIRRYTRSIVEGLDHIHRNGFVHCDIKLQNILVFNDGEIKIADFGLAKKTGEKQSFECRGTPLFMSPESVNNGEHESPADIWALGCAVVEMVTGKPAWNLEKDSNMWSLLLQIGAGEESPLIPEELSKEGKDFVEKCFVKDPRKRWTAEMLLNHPFVEEVINVNESSPRNHFDFNDWVSDASDSVPSSPESEDSNQWDFDSKFCSAVDRLRQLVTDQGPMSWSRSDSWISVR
ncbi:putative mitogen-activated protein kinase kinase kinase STE-STE11 family [Medicago truncatula]|uniref:Putative mitogen-activated protein kinase kinase kinase STE-STE11 family n=1 Tax=Medicago truncatula TaxID=3880 RepID=A0A396IBF6_MEDTR|nr:mitogen-activated protein kinase kinase kinase 20 [Medicago truncatula]RHN62946.1 putative mitogen-activated protein kinase kinase kinase STE-STE11 family [Medicago truncatula]